MVEFRAGDEVVYTSPLNGNSWEATFVDLIGDQGMCGVKRGVDRVRTIVALSNLSLKCGSKIFCPECEEEDYAFVDDYLCAACRCFVWDS